jgi:predicted outer membrane repeat protein
MPNTARPDLENRRARTTRHLLVLLAVAGWAAPAAHAAGTVGTGTPGSCTEGAFSAALSGGGTVTFNCGGGPVVIPITSTKILSASTAIDGTGQQVTLDGGGTTKMFLSTYQLAAGLNLVFRQLTLRNGRAPDQGAAMELVWQEPTRLTNLLIEDVTFQDNVAATSHADWGGGAIYAQTGVFTIRRTRFVGNRGANGGAIGTIAVRITIEDSWFEGNATLPVVGDPFNGGKGGHGGAIYVDGTSLGALTLRRTTFVGNRATNLGGVIHSWMYGLPSALVVEDCTFANNVGTTNGGAIFHMNGRLTISGSTFSGNTVVGQGGALWEGEADPGQTPVSITNSTFAWNSATGLEPGNDGSSGLGGAIRDNGNPTTLTNLTIVANHADWVGGGIVGGSHATLRASIVANNTAANGGHGWNIGKNCSETLADGGFDIQWPTLNPSDGNDKRCAASVAFVEPRLGALSDNGGLTATMSPLAGSPAIDAVASGCPPPATDQRGHARPYGPRCDAGAVEWRETADLGVSLSGGPPAVEGQPISWAIGVSNAGPSAANGSLVADSFPSTVSGVTWTCAPAGGASCPPSGVGNIAMSVTLPMGGSLAIEASGTVVGLGGARQVTNTATVAVPSSMDDPDQANNSASLTIPVFRTMSFHTLTPCRAVDTRNPVGSRGGPSLGHGAPRTFPISGACGVPATAWAVSLNVTVTQPSAPGNVRLYPGGTPAPQTSSINYATGATRANNAVVSLGDAGDLTALASQASGSVHLILDVNGYFE